MSTAVAHIPETAAPPAQTLAWTHARISAAWDHLGRIGAHLTNDEAALYLAALGSAHGAFMRGDEPAMGARLDGLRRFVREGVMERLKLEDPATLDKHGRTAYDRKRTPLEARDYFDVGCPMRPALPNEPGARSDG